MREQIHDPLDWEVVLLRVTQQVEQSSQKHNLHECMDAIQVYTCSSSMYCNMRVR